MPRLETVEDFERLDNALSNPDSKLSEYCVVNYGYCNHCKSLEVFDCSLNDHSQEPECIRCCGCENDFLPDHMGLSHLYYPERSNNPKDQILVYQFRIGGDISEIRHSAEREFFSREHQRKLFKERLESRIKDIKREQRATTSKIRRLAKLRS